MGGVTGVDIQPLRLSATTRKRKCRSQSGPCGRSCKPLTWVGLRNSGDAPIELRLARTLKAAQYTCIPVQRKATWLVTRIAEENRPRLTALWSYDSRGDCKGSVNTVSWVLLTKNCFNIQYVHPWSQPQRRGVWVVRVWSPCNPLYRTCSYAAPLL